VVCRPVEDYPRTLAEFENRFATANACRAYLVRLRWPNGFRCPKCGGAKAWPVRTGLLQCAACGRQTSVTAGTIFQDMRTPLPTWFRAMWWVSSQKTGARRQGPPGLGTGALRNGMDLAAQVASGDGATGARSADGARSKSTRRICGVSRRASAAGRPKRRP
jgi:hypothetical protein